MEKETKSSRLSQVGSVSEHSHLECKIGGTMFASCKTSSTSKNLTRNSMNFDWVWDKIIISSKFPSKFESSRAISKNVAVIFANITWLHWQNCKQQQKNVNEKGWNEYKRKNWLYFYGWIWIKRVSFWQNGRLNETYYWFRGESWWWVLVG